MEPPARREVLGVFGGAGPVASAEFVRTVYQHSSGASEQEYPAVVLRSDPALAARSVLRESGDGELCDELARGLTQLYDQGATTVVICCMTLHQVVPLLPARLRAGLVSVLDLLVDRIAAVGGRHLMLCSPETRDLGLLTSHPRWPAAEPSVVWLDAAGDAVVHGLIRAIKLNDDMTEGARLLTERAAALRVGSLAIGCSEMHVLAKAVGLPAVDPFDEVARAAAAGTLHRLRGGPGHRPAAPRITS